MKVKKNVPTTSPVQTIEKIDQFYEVINFTRDIRKLIVKELLESDQCKEQKLVKALKDAHTLLSRIPQKNQHYLVTTRDNEEIQLDLSYEIRELEKDILFLEKGHTYFFEYLADIHAGFSSQVKEGGTFLAHHPFLNFISDRDGTVNNYCGRYLSSVQSVYNALFLTRFAQKMSGNPVVLTSAPLIERGLATISITPPYTFIYAGSKGREILDKEGNVHTYPLSEEEQHILQRLNQRLEALIAQPEYKIFSLIGSGLQFKRGEITLARQDIYNSIAADKSEHLKQKIYAIVAEIDKDQIFFRIDDTGKDLEIILTVSQKNSETDGKDFDKGDGILFIDKTLNLKLAQGPNLICGDTNSDVPMIVKSIQSSAPTSTIFVTSDEILQQRVISTGADCLFVTEPDILVTVLYKSIL